MPTGYDNRESSRQSFAFAPRRGVQTRNDVAASPSIGRLGMQGEAATGGGRVIQSQAPTLGGNAGANIPSFLDAVFEPVIKAQQDQRVREGIAAALNRESLADIAERQPGLTAIFGPSDFQRGAQFFATQTAVNQWESEQLENMSKLREIPEEDLGRYLNDAAQSFMTGDVFADNAINAAILEKSAVLIPRIAQARVEWQQTELLRRARDTASSSGAAYAALVQSYTTQPDLVEGEADPLAGQRVDIANVNRAKESFLSTFLPIEGMSQEGYKEYIKQSARAFIADGNLWAVNAMDEGGSEGLLFQTLGAEEYSSFKSAYETAGKQAQARALMRIGAEYDTFRTEVRLGQVAPRDVRGRLNEFNVRIATLSGYMEPFFDAEDMIRQTEDRVDDLVTGIEQDQTRAYNEYRAGVERQLDAQERQAAEDRRAATIMAGLSTGDLQAAEFATSSGDVNMAVTAALREDPATTIPLLIRSHRNTSYVSSGAKDILRSQVAANIGAGYESQSFQTAYNNWKAFDADQAGMAARAAYYGEYDTMFARMTTLMGNGSGITGTHAYAQTFGEAGALAGTQAPLSVPDGEAKDKLVAAAGRIGPNFWQRQLGQRQTLSATNTIERLAMGGAYNRMQQDPNLDAETALTMEVSALRADRRIETVGRDAWANPVRGTSMGDLTRVPADRLGRVWESLVDEGLERVNASGRPYTVWRSGAGPETRWIVAVTPRDGEDYEAFEINVPMISSKDTVRERADVSRRRRSTNDAAFARWELTIGSGSMASGSGTRQEQRARFDAEVAAGVANPSGLPRTHPRHPSNR
jgi:hypothetical protein